LLLRYRADEDVGASMRGAGEIRWLVFWPLAPADNEHWATGNARHKFGVATMCSDALSATDGCVIALRAEVAKACRAARKSDCTTNRCQNRPDDRTRS
jgi:hypothetical protein